MLKPGPNYKMSKRNKTILAGILDPHLRGEIKRGMIQADLYAQLQPKREKKPRNGNFVQDTSADE